MTEANRVDFRPVRRDEPHWYRLHLGECPVCGRDKSYRERVAGERPENRGDRIRWIPDTETYDWCDV
jgi:DNA-binding helix-hairpin-helix protein with protein kinase domain